MSQPTPKPKAPTNPTHPPLPTLPQQTMKRLVPLRTALLVLVVLHSSAGPFTSRSTPSLLCRATPVMVGNDSDPVDVPRRSLWELSVVWDKLGHFVARLWHGHHDADDDGCEKRKHPLPGMTSLSANETATTLTTHNDSATVTTHRRLLEEEEKEHSKEAELRALKMVQISRARDVTSHERLWAAVIDDDEEGKKKHDEGYAYHQTTDNPKAHRITTPGQQPVLVGDIVEHYSSLSTVLQDIPEDEVPDTYARNMENPYQESTLPAPEPPSHPKPGHHSGSPYHSQPAEHTEEVESNKDGGKTIYMTSVKTVTEDLPADHVRELPQGEGGDYADKEASVSSPHHERQLFIHPEDFKLHAHKHDNDEDDDDEQNDNVGGPYYSKDGGLWRRKFKGPKTPQGFPLPGSTNHHHLHQHHRQLREQARANMSGTELAQIREEAREELVQALRLAARDAEAQRTDLSVGNSLEAVMNALAVRRPPVPGMTTGTPVTEAKQQDTKGREQVRLPGDEMQPEVENPLPPGRERRRLRGLQQAGAGVGAALVSTFTEAQKAEMRQIFYDAALSMMREAARQALNTNQGGSSGSSNSIFPSANGKNVGSNVVNQDAYAAALTAMVNAVGSKEMNNANGAIASHTGGTGGVVEGGGNNGGGGGAPAKKQSLLEVAREVARHNSPSAGRPPAAAGRRPNGRRNLRGLKNTIRIPVPYTLDPPSNDTAPIFIHNGTDAIYVPLRQVDPSLQEEAFARLGPMGPIIQGAADAIDGESVKATKDGERLGGGQGSVTNPAHPKDLEWAEWLLILVKEHNAKQHWQQEQRTTRNLAEGDAAAVPTTADTATTPPAVPAQSDAAAATTTTTTTTTPTLAGTPGMGNAGNPNLDLGALAGLLQHQFVPPVPGGMGQHTQDPAAAPQTDALGNIITRMMGPMEAKKKKQEEGKEGEGDKAAKDKRKEGEAERPGLGDIFYDRASSQLMSHSASNFQKMQDAMSSIMAQEGIMSWEDGMEGFGE